MNDLATFRFPVRFDVERLVEDLALVRDDEWCPFSFNSDWSGAALRSADGSVRTIAGGTEYQDTPLLRRARYLPEVVEHFRCPLHRVRLLRLRGGGGTIAQHRDPVPEGPPLVRLHVPITGAELADFWLGSLRVDMKAGELWYVDVTRPHSVVNRGTEPRVNLVVDCEVNEWLAAALFGPRAAAS